MTRGGSKRDAQSARRCLVKGNGQSRAGLIRFVLDPEGNLTPDLLEKLGGRGVWVSAERATLETAIAKNHFSRAFKQPVPIADDLLEIIESGLRARLISLVSLARKSGDAIAGADRVSEWLQAGKARVLLQASDGSPREKRNIGDKSEVEGHFECLTRSELGMAFGREYVVHAALTGKGLANRVYADANRLIGVAEPISLEQI